MNNRDQEISHGVAMVAAMIQGVFRSKALAGPRGTGLFVSSALLLLMSTASASSQALRVQTRSFEPRPDLVCVLCSLTVTANPTSTIFALKQGGTSLASTSITITTTLYGISGLNSLKLYAYFSSSTAALTDGLSDNIPTSAVLGQMTTGLPTGYVAFTQSNTLGPAGAGLLLFSTPSLLGVGCILSGASCRTDNLNLEINLSALPQLPAGKYTGTLILQAQAL